MLLLSCDRSGDESAPGGHFPTYEEAASAGSERFLNASKGLLNIPVFRARYLLQATQFLSECSLRGSEEDWRGSFCHVIESIETEPWWTIDPRQALWMLQSFKQAIQTVPLPNVHVIDFAMFNRAYCQQVFGCWPACFLDGAAGNQIEVRCDSRNPAQILQGRDTGLRVVYQFAGDSNAYPGNEFWLGELSSSGDPAAAR